MKVAPLQCVLLGWLLSNSYTLAVYFSKIYYPVRDMGKIFMTSNDTFSLRMISNAF